MGRYRKLVSDGGALSSGRPLVIVAHSDTGLRRVLCRTLRLDGCAVLMASNGAEVVRLLAATSLRVRRPPELLVLGEGLHGWSAAEITEGVQGTWWDSAVLRLVDSGPQETVQESGRTGCVRLSWPCELDDFRTVVLHMLARANRASQSGVFRVPAAAPTRRPRRSRSA
jgi:DNA-binding NtrC family response regulator